MWRPARLWQGYRNNKFHGIRYYNARLTCCRTGADLLVRKDLPDLQERGEVCGLAHRSLSSCEAHCERLNAEDRAAAVRAEKERVRDIYAAPYRVGHPSGHSTPYWRRWIVHRGPLWEQVEASTSGRMIDNLERRGIVEVMRGSGWDLCRLTDYGLWLRDLWIHQDAVAFDRAREARERGA